MEETGRGFQPGIRNGGIPRRIGTMDEAVMRVFSALIDMGIEGYIRDLKKLDKIDPSKYPTLHGRVYDSLQKGEYRILDIYESPLDGALKDSEGNPYYTLVKPVPFERRLAYIFTYEDRNFALFHHHVARSLDERLAVEGVTDPQTYEEKLHGVNLPNVHIEGYRKEGYELVIPFHAFKRLDTLLNEYVVEVEPSPKMREIGVTRSYYVPIHMANFRNLPRHLPTPSFFYTNAMALLNVTHTKSSVFIYAVAYSWSRLLALHDFIKQFIYPGIKKFFAFIPPKEYKDQYGKDTIMEIKRPEGVPKPIKYTDLARFYNSLMEYEYEGKPLGQIKEEDHTLYANIVRTFAYVEAKLKEWRATTFPYETIAGRYL